MPPSRTGSLTPWSVAGARPAAAPRPGPGAPLPTGLPVQRDDRHHLADRRGEERLVGACELGERERALRGGLASSSTSSRVTPGRTPAPCGRRAQLIPADATRCSRWQPPARARPRRAAPRPHPRARPAAGRRTPRRSSSSSRRRAAAPARRRRPSAGRARARGPPRDPSGRLAAVATSSPVGAIEPQHVIGRCGADDEVDQLGQSVCGRERELGDRESEPADVAVEQERHTAVRAHRLEGRASAQQRLVVRAEDRPPPGRRDRGPATATASRLKPRPCR